MACRCASPCVMPSFIALSKSLGTWIGGIWDLQVIGNSWYQRLEMLHVRVPLTDLHTNPRPQHGHPLHLLGALGLNIRGLTRLRDKDLFGVLKADHPIGGLFVQLTLIKVGIALG